MEIPEDSEIQPPIVDKVAEAREARRRRILENSSKRLEKITGRNAAEFEKEAAKEQIIYPDPDTEPIFTEPSPLRHNHQEMFGPGMMGMNDPDQFRGMMDENMAHIMQSLLSNMTSQGGGGGVPGAGPSASAPVEVPDNLIVKLIRTRIPIVCVALMVFLLFHTGHSHLLSNNVLISLLLWETVELFLLKFFNKLGQKRSGITLILTLFNVPQHLVDRGLTMLGMLHKVIQDFSVFLFIFVLLHYACRNLEGTETED